MLRLLTRIRQSASTVKFSFILRDGTKRDVEAEVGKHILEIAKAN